MEKEKNNSNRFAYESDLGLSVVKKGKKESPENDKENIEKSLLDDLQDYKIKQLIAIVDGNDTNKSMAARKILKEKLNL